MANYPISGFNDNDKLLGREPVRFFRDIVLPYSGSDCLIWPHQRTGAGYGVLNFSGKRYYVHRLVCEDVHGPSPEGHQAAHSCGNGHLGCVARPHISWKTRSENQMDRIEHGTSNRGERCASAKLSKDDVREIRNLFGIKSQSSIAKQFGVRDATIDAIRTRRSWSWLE